MISRNNTIGYKVVHAYRFFKRILSYNYTIYSIISDSDDDFILKTFKIPLLLLRVGCSRARSHISYLKTPSLQSWADYSISCMNAQFCWWCSCLPQWKKQGSYSGISTAGDWQDQWMVYRPQYKDPLRQGLCSFVFP